MARLGQGGPSRRPCSLCGGRRCPSRRVQLGSAGCGEGVEGTARRRGHRPAEVPRLAAPRAHEPRHRRSARRRGPCGSLTLVNRGRYPVDPAEASRADASAAVELAANVVELAAGLLGADPGRAVVRRPPSLLGRSDLHVRCDQSRPVGVEAGRAARVRSRTRYGRTASSRGRLLHRARRLERLGRAFGRLGRRRRRTRRGCSETTCRSGRVARSSRRITGMMPLLHTQGRSPVGLLTATREETPAEQGFRGGRGGT